VLVCGDDQILIDFEGVPDPNLATRVLWATLIDSPPPYCAEPVAGVATVAVVLNHDSRTQECRLLACKELLERAAAAIGAQPPAGSRHVIPVCYDRSMAPDLDRVAELSGLSTAEVIELHQSGVYLAELIGFVPGFAYMSGVNPRLSVPRLPHPRPVVPAGSLAMTGNQTAIYPTSTPGGWNLIGRCPTRLFDPARARPSLIALGDEVRFESISVAQFDRLWAKR